MQQNNNDIHETNLIMLEIKKPHIEGCNVLSQTNVNYCILLTLCRKLLMTIVIDQRLRNTEMSSLSLG